MFFFDTHQIMVTYQSHQNVTLNTDFLYKYELPHSEFELHLFFRGCF